MQILKIGEKILNMDQVIEIRIHQDHVGLFFPPRYAIGGSSVKVVELKGREMVAFLSWLEGNMLDITPEPEPKKKRGLF